MLQGDVKEARISKKPNLREIIKKKFDLCFYEVSILLPLQTIIDSIFIALFFELLNQITMYFVAYVSRSFKSSMTISKKYDDKKWVPIRYFQRIRLQNYKNELKF